jgi:hypothetical protein
MMVVVAAVAATLAGCIWGEKLLRLSRRYRDEAYQFARYETWSKDILAQSYESVVFFTKKVESNPDRAERWKARVAKWSKSADAERHRLPKLASIRRRYERLVYRPWEPEPPELDAELPSPPVPR